jgi:hypothetical protein
MVPGRSKRREVCSQDGRLRSLFGFEQLLHRHGLVDVILGSRDLLTGDQEAHIRLNQILRIVATSRLNLYLRCMRRRQDIQTN